MAKTIAALFDNRTEAYDAVHDLVEHGFSRHDISVMAHDDNRVDGPMTVDEGPSGAAQGAGIGAALGGIGGLVIGLSALAVPGVGPVLAAGPLAAALLGAGVGAAAGGLLGALTDIGVSEEHAHYYSEGVRRGGVLVTTATTDERAEEAVALLSRHNPIDVSRRAEEWRQNGWNRFDPQSEPYGSATARGAAGSVMERQAPPARATAAGASTSSGRAFAAGAAPAARPAEPGRRTDVAFEDGRAPFHTERRSFEEYDPDFRRHFSTAFGQPDTAYDTYMPAYRYGYTLAQDSRYSQHHDWTLLAPEAQRDWERQHPGTWERFKNAIRHAWEEVRGRR